MEILGIVQIMVIAMCSVVIHEYAHGFVAFHRGDPTAKLMGRLTLNPIKHIDPVGTILVPLVLKLLGAPILGWAKPVPVNFNNLYNPKRDMILVAAAGPAVNLTCAYLLSRLLKVFPVGAAADFLTIAVIINLVLAIFNLIPVPPLDGSRIIMGLLPDAAARLYARLEPFGLIIVIVLLNFGVMRIIWSVVGILAILFGVNFS